MKKIKSIEGVEIGNMYLVDRSKEVGKFHYAGAYDGTLVYQLLICKGRFGMRNNLKCWFKCDSYWLKSRRLLDSLAKALTNTRLYTKTQWGFTRLKENHFNEFDIYELNKEESAIMMAKIMLARIGK